MKPVYLTGCGLACALGLDVGMSVASMGLNFDATSFYALPTQPDIHFPYRAIAFDQGDWNERASHLIRRVAHEAGSQHIGKGVLFIATSSFDIGAVEHGETGMDYKAFTDKVARWLDWSGPVYLISTACTSSINAMIAVHALLSTGELTDALVLGVELDNRLTLGGFAALQLLSRNSSKPFGADRDGLVLGEAVAALRFSTREISPWKILGGANVVDGKQPTSASASAVLRMYQRALVNSGLAADDVDLIKVQAAGSPGNDAIEAQGLREMFQVIPPLVSLKSVIGHAMGASGAAEVALLTACLDQDVWPMYADAVDELLGVHLAARQPEPVRHVMATILGFGGGHATVVLERA
jgi:3-oxoacyl-[acyl-carrier-protein] synthase-1